MRYLIALAITVVSCSILPDDALNYIPSSARIVSFHFEQHTEKSPTPVHSSNAKLTYQGSFNDPSRIEVAWPTDFQLMHIPILDRDRRIAKTIYELDNWRVLKITNINDHNKIARIETFTYTGSRIRLHEQTNYVNGEEINKFTNQFFYKSRVVDSVHQTVCFADSSCWNGFLVALEGRSGDIGLYDGCQNGTVVAEANYFSIMPYAPEEPYSYEQRTDQYWDASEQAWVYSVNNYEKSHHRIDASGSSATSKLNSFPGNSNCESVFFTAGFFYGNDWPVFGYQTYAEGRLGNSFDRDFAPVYYHVLQRPNENSEEDQALIPQAAFLEALTRKVDFAYYRKAGSFQQDNESTYTVTYGLEMSGE